MNTALIQDLNRLVEREPLPQPLPPATPYAHIDVRQGLARTQDVGIASPLVEIDYNAREWHNTMVFSSDGLFALPQIKSITLRDARGRQVLLEFARKP